jgi:prolyl-tRNA editing enzyme YbaK/EbsC (Cys-tRNA(Pro) deacylase)
MDKLRTKKAQDIQDFLHKKGVECKVLELPSSTRTAQDAADSLKCSIGQIAKSLVFKTEKSGKPILVLASGANRVNEKLIALGVGEGVQKADADFVREVTGFAIGGIPPVGHVQAIDFIFVDKDLLQFDTVWAAAGTPHAVFNVKTKDLLSLVDGKLISVC